MSKEKSERIGEYLTNALTDGKDYQFKQSTILKNLYVLANENKRIILLSDAIPEKTYNHILERAHQSNLKTITLFYKDGTTFFRNAGYGQNAGLKGVAYKQQQELSLKNYSTEDVRRMIALTPTELRNVHQGRKALYYQPGSERLEEKIIKNTFEPVMLDYSHIPDGKRFGPKQKPSERIYLHSRTEEVGPKIIFDDQGFRTYTP